MKLFPWKWSRILTRRHCSPTNISPADLISEIISACGSSAGRFTLKCCVWFFNKIEPVSGIRGIKHLRMCCWRRMLTVGTVTRVDYFALTAHRSFRDVVPCSSAPSVLCCQCGGTHTHLPSEECVNFCHVFSLCTFLLWVFPKCVCVLCTAL